MGVLSSAFDRSRAHYGTDDTRPGLARRRHARARVRTRSHVRTGRLGTASRPRDGAARPTWATNSCGPAARTRFCTTAVSPRRRRDHVRDRGGDALRRPAAPRPLVEATGAARPDLLRRVLVPPSALRIDDTDSGRNDRGAALHCPYRRDARRVVRVVSLSRAAHSRRHTHDQTDAGTGSRRAGRSPRRCLRVGAPPAAATFVNRLTTTVVAYFEHRRLATPPNKLRVLVAGIAGIRATTASAGHVHRSGHRRCVVRLVRMRDRAGDIVTAAGGFLPRSHDCDQWPKVFRQLVDAYRPSVVVLMVGDQEVFDRAVGDQCCTWAPPPGNRCSTTSSTSPERARRRRSPTHRDDEPVSELDQHHRRVSHHRAQCAPAPGREHRACGSTHRSGTFSSPIWPRSSAPTDARYGFTAPT